MKWYFENHVIQTGTKYLIGSSRSKRSLEILNVHVTDAGTYRCVAESSRGSISCQFTLDVTARPRSALASFNQDM